MKRSPPPPSTPLRRLRLGALRDNLGYLSRVLRNVNVQSSGRHVKELGFLTGQITLLGLIAANEGVTQNELARAILMSKSQVTGLIQDLVARGLVAREEHGDDRRFNTLALTAEGTKAWKKALARITRHSDEIQTPLDAAERAELARLMRKLLAANLPDADIDFE